MTEFKSIIDFLNYYWPHRKTKLGFIILLCFLLPAWLKFAFPQYQSHPDAVLLTTGAVLLLLIVLWGIYSGRFLLPSRKFTVVFCLKATDPKSIRHIHNALSILRSKLDEIGMLSKFRIKLVGKDVITDSEDAHAYRERFDTDLIIWGEVFAGSKENKEASDFQKISYTYKIPGNIVLNNVSDIFKSDINIALVHRDWNIYEVNSLPDTDKISANLSEVILFIIGLIYCQGQEFAEDSVGILEQLFKLLSAQIKKDERPIFNHANNTLQFTPPLLRQSRVLGILLAVYKNLGAYFIGQRDYGKARFYLAKFRAHENRDIVVLSWLAVASFYLDDIKAAKLYTEEICSLDDQNEICLVNSGFWRIYEKNYASALHYYRQISKRGKIKTNAVVTSVIAFLDERKAENPKELAYDFAIGIMNYFCCQKEIGKKELYRFIKKANGQPLYNEMCCFVKNEVLENKKWRRK